MEQRPQVRIVDVFPTLAAATELARASRHPHVGSEHLALLALDGPHGIEAMAAEAGIDVAGIRPALEGCCISPKRDAEPAVTLRLVRLLAFAAQLALGERSSAIRPIDLVMVLIADQQAAAWAGLRSAGVTPDVLMAGLARRAMPIQPATRAN